MNASANSVRQAFRLLVKGAFRLRGAAKRREGARVANLALGCVQDAPGIGRRDACPAIRFGFTLIELLVVIAIIAILAAILMPVLSKAKMQGLRAQSANNIRNLQIGANMYANDNNGYLLPNAPYYPTIPGAKAWIDVSSTAYEESLTESFVGNTNTALYTDALLAPFMSDQLGVYKSPADTMASPNGQRIRSYSMNSQMGCVYLISAPNNYNGDPGALQYSRESDLKFPITPSQGFVFCEESQYTINDGFLQVGVVPGSTTALGFPDVPASYLGGACAFSFADGHVEIHKWMTGTLLNATAAYPNLVVGIKNVDWIWFSQHAAAAAP